jgi:histidinol-phosphate aminotransferase
VRAFGTGGEASAITRRIQLDANEAPRMLGSLRRRLTQRLSRLAFNRYPDPSRLLEAATALASLHGVEPSRVFLGNGSNEVLLAIHLGFGGPGRRAVIFVPTYTVYAKVAGLVGTELVEVVREKDFAITRSVIDTLVEVSPHVVHLCTPNNPTGTEDRVELVVELAQRLPSSLVVVDRAYGTFGGDGAERTWMELPNVVIVRTFSKAAGLAGLRIGYAIVPGGMRDVFEKLFLPYNVDAASIEAVILAAECIDEIKEMEKTLAEGRQYLEREISKRRSLIAFPSQANFVLFGPAGAGIADGVPEEVAYALGARAKSLHEALAAKGILVRDCTQWPGLVGCLRVSAGLPEENEAFVACLDDALAAAGIG